MVLVFSLCLFLVVYTYVLYPLLLLLLNLIPSSQRYEGLLVPQTEDAWPTVTMVVPAFNEQVVILDKIKNFLALDYPANRIELLIGSDGSTDQTNELVRNQISDQIRLAAFPVRRGKATVLNNLIPEARGEIVVLSDANTVYDPLAVKELTRAFADPKVGGVVGRLVLDPASRETVSESQYWRFEQILKRVEGRHGSVLGGTGGIYAIRRELYRPIQTSTIVDDFVIGLNILAQGFRMVYSRGAIARETTARNLLSEFERRARIGAGGFQTLFWYWRLLNPKRRFVALSFFSHKVLRWLMPFFMIALVICTIFLTSDPFFNWMLIAEALVGAMALTGHLLTRHHYTAPTPIRLAYYFVLMNTALLIGAFRFIRRTQSAAWKRTERVELQPGASASSTHRAPEDESLQ